ncbi:MAG: alpha/beta hydrolase [Dermatophilaceae bacterium]
MTELLGAKSDVLDQMASSLSADADRVHDIRNQAQRAVAELQAGWNGPDLGMLTQQWEQQASAQLSGASASLDACAATLRAQSSAQRWTSRSGDDPGCTFTRTMLSATPGMAWLSGRDGNTPTGPPVSTGLPAYPPSQGSPTDNASWWKALGSRQQEQVIGEHPGWIGNLDGVPFAARDLANRALIFTNRTELVTQGQRLEADLADNWHGDVFTTDDEALEQVRDKLAALAAIEQTLAKPGPRQLILLDLEPERAQAAIARGNIDSADNVAVFVPGMTATVTDGLGGYDSDMDQLQHRAELESKRANPNQHLTTATVTWIGYQAPQLGWDLIGANSVADDHAAQAGAAKLVPFLRGIDAARDHDAHLSVLGHSYGSTTAGLALQQDTGVDDVVFFGSPGIGTNHLEDLSVPEGHTYYIEARWDPVGDLGQFGLDPSHLAGIDHASAKASTVVDPVTGEIRRLTEVTGHTSYLVDDSTSQYNMSVVVAGVPHRRVFDLGEGFGDVLSRPVPGTNR